MDHEQLLLSKVIEETSLLEITDLGIKAECFLDPTNRSLFKAILAYSHEHGTVPSLRRIKRDFPNFKFVSVDEPVTDLVDLTRKYYKLAVLEEALSDAVVAYDAEDENLVAEIISKAQKKIYSDSVGLRDVDLSKNGQDRLDRYEEYKHLTDGMRGIRSGFPTIDKATQGFQKQQLVTFVGPPKAGKSTIMLLAADAAHRAGYKPLLIGFEMSNEEQEQRLDAIAAKISHHRLRNGTLTKEEWAKLKRSVNGYASMKSFILSNDSQSTTVVSGIQAKVEKHQPDILIVDGVYMMQDEHGESPGSPQALTNITRAMKRMAQNLQIPIIITTQALEWKMDRKKGLTSGSIGYSSSFAQDSDTIIGVESTDDERIKKVKILLARNCPPLEVYVQWDWETGEFQELSGNPFEESEDGTWSGADF